MYVGEATVKTHVAHVLTKLGVRDRVQAVVLAYESGVVRPGRDERPRAVIRPFIGWASRCSAAIALAHRPEIPTRSPGTDERRARGGGARLLSSARCASGSTVRKSASVLPPPSQLVSSAVGASPNLGIGVFVAFSGRASTRSKHDVEKRSVSSSL